MSTPSHFSIDITQPPLDTSQLGVMQAASTYYGLSWTTPELFVGSGHGFVTNVSFDLCPSGPYVWQTSPMLELFSNLNLDVEMIGMTFPARSSEAERAEFESILKQALVEGNVCTILCLDHQVVQGFDDEGFVLAQPWAPTVESTPPRLDYGSWQGFSDGPPIGAFAVTTNSDTHATRDILRQAITYGLTVWDEHASHSYDERYGMGPAAYPKWQQALDDGQGEQHGAWWNGVVWGECKMMTSRYFEGLNGDMNGATDLTKQIAAAYRESAQAMFTASDLQLEREKKKQAVRQAEEAETLAVAKLRELLPLL
ncbi:MAG: hypothetical protein F4W90_06980 [Gammaproteobacteria bacterium]|nr:hypothetical protein [Gammaproteobacteria bacterium]